MASASARLPILACSRARLLLGTYPTRLKYISASKRGVATTQWNAQVQRRYGKGAEPPTWEQQRQDREAAEDEDAAEEGALRTDSTTATTTRDAIPPTDHEIKAEEGTASGSAEQDEKSEAEEAAQEGVSQAAGNTQSKAQDHGPSSTPEEAAEKQVQEGQKQTGPMEAVLHMAPPRQHPHLAPPPYVHHFDTYSLVKQLGEGGYTQEQAIEVMKGVRAILAQNLDVAQESLVSKSDVENVSLP